MTTGWGRPGGERPMGRDQKILTRVRGDRSGCRRWLGPLGVGLGLPGRSEADWERLRENSFTSEDQMDHVRRVKRAYEEELMDKANVVGVGIGLRQREGEPTDEPVIVVSVTRKVSSSMLDPDDTIPQELEGVGVDVRPIGEPRALETSARGHDG